MINQLHHICIQSEVYDQSLAFYTKIMGFELVKETAGFHGRSYNTWLKHGTFMIELQTPKAGTAFKPWSNLNQGPVHMAFTTDDVDVAYTLLTEKGHREFKLKNGEPVYEVEGGKLLKVIAPEGTEIELRDQTEI